jgi:hypothetical protein
MASKPNPYCSFKSDVERRKALQSRDVRLVLLGLVGVASSSSVWHLLSRWFV